MPSLLAPTVEAPAVVVVTGANGFVAQHCIDQLLDEGFHVVGTVRSAAKASSVLDTHYFHPHLRAVVVADITSPSDYINALRPFSPSAICHVAAPFCPHVTSIEHDLMIPAIQGSTAIMEAAAQLGTVRKVAYMSSFAAVLDHSLGLNPGRTYTEQDWSPLSYEHGAQAQDWLTGYITGKACAERATREFLARRRDAAFDLVSLCPTMIHGPWLPRGLPRNVGDINTSNKIIYDVVTAGRHATIPANRLPLWVDVRDVATACVRALTFPEAAGGRFLLNAGDYSNQEIADVARKLAPKSDRIPIGQPGSGSPFEHFHGDASETERVLGIRWRSLRQSLAALMPQLAAIGAQDAPADAPAEGYPIRVF